MFQVILGKPLEYLGDWALKTHINTMHDTYGFLVKPKEAAPIPSQLAPQLPVASAQWGACVGRRHEA